MLECLYLYLCLCLPLPTLPCRFRFRFRFLDFTSNPSSHLISKYPTKHPPQSARPVRSSPSRAITISCSLIAPRHNRFGLASPARATRLGHTHRITSHRLATNRRASQLSHPASASALLEPLSHAIAIAQRGRASRRRQQPRRAALFSAMMKEFLDSDRLNYLVWRFVFFPPSPFPSTRAHVTPYCTAASDWGHRFLIR